MADIPPPPISQPIQTPDGQMSPDWVRWFKRLETIIKGLS